MEKKKVAVLTGGGCAPGLDPFLESFTKVMSRIGYEVLGISYGWEGLEGEEPDTSILSPVKVEGLVRSGGTLIGTSRANPFKDGELADAVAANLEKLKQKGVEGLVVAGGDDTLGVAKKLAKLGYNVIGVPKTMDLDLATTDYSMGFWSYVEAVFDKAVPGFITTLQAHHRVGVLEVFGRISGFTAAAIGIASGACYIAVPEFEIDLDELAARVKEFYDPFNWALVVVGEGIKVGKADEAKLDPHFNDLLKERQVGKAIAKQIEVMTGLEAREFQATHPFRGIPSAYDAMFGFRLGRKAAKMVHDGEWGKMIASKGDELMVVPLGSHAPRRVIEPGSHWAELVSGRNQGLF